MPKLQLDMNVLQAAGLRIRELFQAGHRLVFSVSGGIDSTVLMEVGIQVARELGCLPIDAIMRDEEIMFPGTFEYMERVAARPKEVTLHWVYANQPIINIFNRERPYWWVFDPLLPAAEWVRQPPPFAYKIPEIDIRALVSPLRFPAAPGKRLYTLTGLLAEESINRRRAIYSSQGHGTLHPNEFGSFYSRPLYDWKKADIWFAIKTLELDYNTAYDVMFQYGMARNEIRLAPPTMTPGSADSLKMASAAWPQWFEKVAIRCPGMRLGSQFGRAATKPIRRHNETWSQCFQRLCIEDAPKWISDRSQCVKELQLREHSHHSAAPFPEVKGCVRCGLLASWKALTLAMYNGDPFCSKLGSGSAGKKVGQVDPEFFRPGAGRWGA